MARQPEAHIDLQASGKAANGGDVFNVPEHDGILPPRESMARKAPVAHDTVARPPWRRVFNLP
jgi:hypothetical protein